MKNSDSSPPMDSNVPEKVEGELLHGDESASHDPMNAILDQTFQDEIDNERLYTDEFIRANENASRSLFLGFLGAALLGTSLVAWFILSQPDDPVQPTPDPVLSVPPTAIPNLDPNVPSPGSVPNQPTNVPPGGNVQTPVFPVAPINPVAPNGDTSGTSSTPSPSPSSLLPEGVVPPPPPVVPSPNSGGQ